MRELRDAIIQKGKALGGNVVKVDMFLNHRLDTALIFRMGAAFAEHFRAKQPEVILTVEASGIALALATARALSDLPVLFAKKSAGAAQGEGLAQAPVYSFTHKKWNNICVDKAYLPEGTRVLIIDDFLADGQAVRGMRMLCEQCACPVVGVGIGIEKGFQDGGMDLRRDGVNLLSLAVITGISPEGELLVEG